MNSAVDVHTIQNLVEDLTSKLKANFQKVVLAMLMTPAEYDAQLLNRAIITKVLQSVLSVRVPSMLQMPSDTVFCI